MILKIDESMNSTDIMISENGLFLISAVQSIARVKGWKLSFENHLYHMLNSEKFDLKASYLVCINQDGQNFAFSNNGN
jgi:hypothetical protein